MKAAAEKARPLQTPLTVETERGVSILWQNKYLYSRYAPLERAIQSAQKTEITPSTLYLIPSPLLFHGVKTLIDKMDPNSIIMAIEFEKELQLFTQERFQKLKTDCSIACSLIVEKRLFYTDSSPVAILSASRDLVKAHSIRRVTTVILSGGYNIHAEKYNYIAHEIASSISTYWKNRSTINQLAPLWFRNIFLNIPTITQSDSFALLNPRKLQCAVTGAGETLESSFAELKTNRLKYFIIAADTSLPALLEAGITPDCLIALEAQHHNLKDCLTDQKKLKKIKLIADISSSPTLIRQFDSCSFFKTAFSQSQLFKRIKNNFPHLPEAPQLGSVGITALYFAMIFSPENGDIYCAGLDFSWIRGKSHSKGTFYHTLLLQIGNRLNGGCEAFYSLSQPEKSAHYIPNHKEKGLITTSALENYFNTACDLLKLSNCSISGPALLSKSWNLTNNKTTPINSDNQNWLASQRKQFYKQVNIDSKSKMISDFICYEKDLLDTILNKQDGIEEYIKPGKTADYLTEMLILKSSQKIDNNYSGAIKMRANRLYEILKRQSQSD